MVPPRAAAAGAKTQQTAAPATAPSRGQWTVSPWIHELRHGGHSLGHVQGVTYAEDGAGAAAKCHALLGIPYAQPPTGDYRFRPPRPLAPCYRYGTIASPAVFDSVCGVCPQAMPAGAAKATAYLDEDCLQANVWIPAGKAPAAGWPILFFLHGGFLQAGTANTVDPRHLLTDTTLKAIFIAPAYRLNVLGFLASKELAEEAGESDYGVGNYGFWDQRIALEWTRKLAAYLDGDPLNITMAGYSAGAHSAFHQLAYDIRQQPSKRIIRKVILHSNGPGLPPKSLDEAQLQADMLFKTLGISPSISAAERLKILRALPPRKLADAAASIALHEFRAVSSPNGFVNSDLFTDINSGKFAQKLVDAQVSLVMGECADEHWLYAQWRSANVRDLESLRKRLYADYPARLVDVVLRDVYCKDGKLPTVNGTRATSWKQGFGLIYSDLQIHATQRGLAARLAPAAHLIYRYRIEWRAECTAALAPREAGVTHGTDSVGVWMYGGARPTAQDRAVVDEFVAPVWAWVMSSGAGGPENWGPASVEQCRRLTGDGRIDTWTDTRLQDGLAVWSAATAVKDTPSKL